MNTKSDLEQALVGRLVELFGDDLTSFKEVMCSLNCATEGAVASTLGSRSLLEELAVRGGHPGALAEAALLCMRKSQDYNHGQVQDPHSIDRSAYFPFGTVSYAQMLYTKAMRFNSLAQKELDGGRAEFEGLRDTALDIINYAGFFAGQRRKG